MVNGYAAHITAIRMAPRLEPGALVRLIGDHRSDFVERKDGTQWTFDTQDAFVALTDTAIATELPRVWLTGSLLALGDALKVHAYFGHVPLFELVRHLRNGIAHGNRFDVQYPVELEKYPAHNHDAAFRGPNNSLFEIAPTLNGLPILFEFMGAGDVLELLCSVAIYLDRIGYGETP
jgi:hypothetical protein